MTKIKFKIGAGRHDGRSKRHATATFRKQWEVRPEGRCIGVCVRLNTSTSIVNEIVRGRECEFVL